MQSRLDETKSYLNETDLQTQHKEAKGEAKQRVRQSIAHRIYSSL